MIRRVLVVPIVVLTLVAVSGPAPSATAVDHSRGHPGFCRNANGVTVVIDFQELNGTTIVRCNPQSTRGTGLDALKGAGIQIAGVQRWGESFICRIENRPSATETIDVDGQPGYREACIDTPPAAAYWSYWHAGNNCPWTYSQWGVKNRDFTPGGFEGWSFSLNATADSNPVPRIAPVRPGTEGAECTTPVEPGPTENDPDERLDPVTTRSTTDTSRARGAAPVTAGSAARPDAPGTDPAHGAGGSTPPLGGSDSGSVGHDAHGDPLADGASGTGGVDGSSAGDDVGGESSGSSDRSLAAGADPAANVEFTGGEHAPDVRDVIRTESGASDAAPWIALGVIIVLAGFAGWVEGRRRRRRHG